MIQRSLWAFRRATAENRRHPLANAEVARIYYQNALALLQSGDRRGHARILGGALSAADWARKVNPLCWEAAAWRGVILAERWSKQDVELAKQDLAAALKLAPPADLARARRLQQVTLSRLGQ